MEKPSNIAWEDKVLQVNKLFANMEVNNQNMHVCK